MECTGREMDEMWCRGRDGTGRDGEGEGVM